MDVKIYARMLRQEIPFIFNEDLDFIECAEGKAIMPGYYTFEITGDEDLLDEIATWARKQGDFKVLGFSPKT